MLSYTIIVLGSRNSFSKWFESELEQSSKGNLNALNVSDKSLIGAAIDFAHSH